MSSGDPKQNDRDLTVLLKAVRSRPEPSGRNRPEPSGQRP